MLKIGDTVIALDYINSDSWSGNMVVTDISGPIILCRHPTMGCSGFNANRLKLVEENIDNLTDQQLADKYRSLRAEGQKIATMLRNRGYKTQNKRPSWCYFQDMRDASGDTYRFIKTETVTKEI